MFKMAANNARENTGETITEEQINAVIRKSLDEVNTQKLCCIQKIFSILTNVCTWTGKADVSGRPTGFCRESEV